MTEDEILTVRYVDFLEENKLINKSIINAEKKKARKIGLEEGRAKGLAKGLKKGLAKGLAEGRKEGRKEGRIEGRAELIINMFKNGQSIETISKICNLKIKEVKDIIDKMESN